MGYRNEHLKTLASDYSSDQMGGGGGGIDFYNILNSRQSERIFGISRGDKNHEIKLT